MTILTLQPNATDSKDTYITATGTQTFNYGVSTSIITGGSPSTYRGLIQFALENIPPGSTINSATLTLVAAAVNSSSPFDVEVHRALTLWYEGNGNGAAPTGFGSTWAKREHFFSVNWGSSTLGGLSGTDFSASAAATTSVAGTGTYTWDLTAEVDAIVNGPLFNYGWWLIQPSGGSKTFVSSDDSGRPSDWPKLVIDYTPGTNSVLVVQPDSTTGNDTIIDGSSGASNFGIFSPLYTGRANIGTTNFRALIKFDLSSLPAGVSIVSATITMRQSYSIGAAANVNIHRSLVAWFEGVQNNAVPPAGQDGSTWNLRNANGSLAWAGGAGGASGLDWAATPSDTKNIGTTASTDYKFDVTADVQGFVDGDFSNLGWWFIGDEAGPNTKGFSTSESTTPDNRPKIVVVYQPGFVVAGVTAGTSTASGTLSTANGILYQSQPDAAAGIDTIIKGFSSFVTFNYGVATTLRSGNDGAWQKSLIKFDLSSIPSGATIVYALVSLNATGGAGSATYGLHRSLVQWFEGTKNGAAPGAGEDGSTWNLRNANGSLGWGTVGGLSGTDYSASATASLAISTTGNKLFNVTTDVQNFVNGITTNHGWWIVTPNVGSTYRDFASSDNATATLRPQITIFYKLLAGTIAGTSTAVGILKGVTSLEASAAGTSTAVALITSNQNLKGLAAGTSTATAVKKAFVRALGNSFGDSTAIARIKADYHSVGAVAGTSFAVAHLKGKFNLRGLSSGQGTAIAHIIVKGHIFGQAFGTSTAIATAYARAVRVAAVIGCNPVPLLYITDGSVRPNGQLNILNFLSENNGYILRNYKPQIPQYKEGGYFSSSPQSQGRRLRSKAFDNAIDLFEVAAKSWDQDALIQYQQDLISFQEASSDYWTSDFAFQPCYLVARAARETNTRHAIIHLISCPELENPFSQPFFSHNSVAFAALTIRIEHGIWLSTPPGKADCVDISGQREWTVSGWQSV